MPAGVRPAAPSPAMPAGASIVTAPASAHPSNDDAGTAATANGMATASRVAAPAGATRFDEPPVAGPTPIVDDPMVPVPDEVVQVHEADGALSFVIRDRSLADAAAVRCALETARRLTGDARAVRQVTLNGRTIYTDASPAPRPRGTGASFTC
ncbi:hypothetical protein A4W93_05110 [Piscinibacter gummiphilus]|uniref:Uncharacterized protein n=2 Tax=Piscinibacter gummiphilus TaxID=946333 RepID=A0A1W6L580_9BURK|nr:hypothetical protein A4W93_05110 [Piscinibacter gummiphilus]ATU64004.1 hypothetical protein CPZ87_05195 [Piscinibacter gummiphilus]